MDRFIVSVMDGVGGTICDQLTISLSIFQQKPQGREEILNLEENLRSILLKIMMLG